MNGLVSQALNMAKRLILYASAYREIVKPKQSPDAIAEKYAQLRARVRIKKIDTGVYQVRSKSLILPSSHYLEISESSGGTLCSIRMNSFEMGLILFTVSLLGLCFIAAPVASVVNYFLFQGNEEILIIGLACMGMAVMIFFWIRLISILLRFLSRERYLIKKLNEALRKP